MIAVILAMAAVLTQASSTVSTLGWAGDEKYFDSHVPLRQKGPGHVDSPWAIKHCDTVCEIINRVGCLAGAAFITNYNRAIGMSYTAVCLTFDHGPRASCTKACLDTTFMYQVPRKGETSF